MSNLGIVPQPAMPPRVQRIFELIQIAIDVYPQNAFGLCEVLRRLIFLRDNGLLGSFVDTRAPRVFFHVTPPVFLTFVDHSNILYGFFRHLDATSGTRGRLSYSALTALLERGRPVSRRCLVTSRPLHQPLNTAQRLGYNMALLRRVVTEPFGIMREQGVDEVLQNKIWESISRYDRPAQGSTIVLATGDGGSSEFSEFGFPGCVRFALRQGWNVELFSWSGMLSQTWWEISRNYQGMSIHFLDNYAPLLVE